MFYIKTDDGDKVTDPDQQQGDPERPELLAGWSGIRDRCRVIAQPAPVVTFSLTPQAVAGPTVAA